MLKVFSFFKIQILFAKNEVKEFSTQCNSWNKTVTCEFYETVTIDILTFFIKAIVFNHVGLSWIILTKDQHEFYVEENYIEWCTGGPWFNETTFRNLHSPTFDEFFVTARQYRYELMCGLYSYNKENYRSTDATKFGGGRTIPDDSTTISLVSICVSIKLIDTWINILAKNFACNCFAYQDNMR